MADPIEAVRETREAVFEKGARFYEKDGVVLFACRIDAGSVFGPFEATDAHKKEHATEYAEFLASKEPAAKPALAKEHPKGPPKIPPKTFSSTLGRSSAKHK